MRGLKWSVVLAALALGAVPARSQGSGQKPILKVLSGPAIRLAALSDGLRGDAPKRDLSRLREAKIYDVAQSVGVDLEALVHPFVAAKRSGQRVFYVFYKHCESAYADRPYLIQRIKKTERTWKTKGSQPAVKISYQVEVFKTLGGATKGLDRHYGRFGLKGNYRRQILKEYEIGFGEVVGACEGTAWPFADNTLFAMLQKYQPDAGLYSKTELVEPLRWSLDVDLDEGGAWKVASEELGLAAPERLPQLGEVDPVSIAESAKVTLSGKMLGRVRKSQCGATIERVTFAGGTSSVTTDLGLRFSVGAGGQAYRVATLPGFAGSAWVARASGARGAGEGSGEGSAKEGLRHGMSRVLVARRAGFPSGQVYRARTWTFGEEPVLEVRFDALGRVDRLVVSAPR